MESGGTTVLTVSNSPYIQMNLIGNREYMFKVKAATNGGIGPDTFNSVTTLSGGQSI